ncbi:MAG: fibronectin type III domain-containing protein, partial [Silanimonas sp.]
MRLRSFLFAVAQSAALGLSVSPMVSANSIPVTDAASLDLGERSGCFVTAGTGVRCWGNNDDGRGGSGFIQPRSTSMADDVVGLLSGVRSVSVGGSHACAALLDGTARCWGSNDAGQLGDGTTEDRPDPAVVAGLTDVRTISAGARHTCAVLASGRVKCWGDNGMNQLGGIDVAGSRTPVDVPGLDAQMASTVESGASDSCAVFSSGAVRCWGGLARTPGSVQINARAAIIPGLESGVRGVALAPSHRCAVLANGGVRCWGFNAAGQLGDGTTIQRGVPVAVLGLGGPARMVAVGYSHSCAVVEGRGVQCWGLNTSGQLGSGGFGSRSAPITVAGLGADIAEVRADRDATCARSSSGAVSCWGRNEDGSIGDGDAEANPTPSDVVGLAGIVQQVSLGTRHACALSAEGAVSCWGTDEYATLANDEPFGTRLVATPIPGLESGFGSIAVGFGFACASRPSDGVWCWGANARGELGDGTTQPRGSPAKLRGVAPDPRQVVAGDRHACALDRSGDVWCWGSNLFGELGRGTTSFDAGQALRVIGLPAGTIERLSVSAASTCAAYADGTQWCWGANFEGQLGDGTYTNRPSPARSTAFPEPIRLRSDSCAISADGTMRCTALFRGTPTRPTTQETYAPLPLAMVSRALTCVLAADRTVRCAGPNGSGQSGHGVEPQWGDVGWAPVQGLGGPATSIAAMPLYACATLASGGARCWGSNRDGILGNGRGPVHLLPVALRQRPVLVGVTVPSAPANLSVTFANGAVRVAPSAPSTNGGTPVLFYEVTASPGGQTLRCGGLQSCEVAFLDLPLGESYVFSARAVNRAGRSAAANSAPFVNRGAQRIAFEQPRDTPFGFSAIVLATADSGLQVRFRSTTPSICDVTLAARVVPVRAGRCTIIAEQPGNVIYEAAEPVERSFSFLPALPERPSGATASLASSRATVRFLAPENQGGVAIDGYRIVSTPEGRVVMCTGGVPCEAVFDNLAQGVGYSFAVHARNAVGEGPASIATNTVTPVTAPPSSVVVARPDQATLPRRVRDAVLDVLANDAFDPAGMAGGSLSVVVAPSSGSAWVDHRGTPSAGDDRIGYSQFWSRGDFDRLRYRLCDAGGACAEADVDIDLKPFETATGLDLTVDRPSGFRDVAIRSATPVVGARYDTTPLVVANDAVIATGVDPAPASPWDDSGAGTGFVLGELSAPADSGRSWSVLVDLLAGSTDADLYFGVDSDRDGRPSAAETLCSATTSAAAKRCDRSLSLAAGERLTYWALVHGRTGAARQIGLRHAAVPMVDSDGSLVVTGPARSTSSSDRPLRIQWRDHTLLAGQTRVGFVRVSQEEIPPGRLPIVIMASELVETPIALSSGKAISSSLAPGTSHSRTFIDVPVGATELRVVAASSGATEFYLARTAALEPDAAVPSIAPAPPRGDAVMASASSSREHVLSVPSPPAGRWYLVPRNPGTTAVNVELSAVVRGDFAVARSGGYFNPQRSGSGLFVHRAGAAWAGLWYTFLQDGRPTWYYLQGAAPVPGEIWRAE